MCIRILELGTYCFFSIPSLSSLRHLDLTRYLKFFLVHVQIGSLHDHDNSGPIIQIHVIFKYVMGLGI